MDLEKIAEFLLSHWAFVAVAIILAVVGQVVKTLVVGSNKKQDLIGWKDVFIKTLPLHPVLAGGILGLALDATIPESLMTGGTIGSVLYFALAGAASSWIYNTLKGIMPTIINRFVPPNNRNSNPE